jgi:hypothetical protein
MWTLCMLREDIADGDMTRLGLRELLSGERLCSFCMICITQSLVSSHIVLLLASFVRTGKMHVSRK